MDANELAEYKRRLRLREQRRAAVRWAVGYTSHPGRALPRLKSRQRGDSYNTSKEAMERRAMERRAIMNGE